MQHDQSHYSNQGGGFILPALIVISLVLMSMGLVALQYVTASTGSIQSSYYTSVAKSAADAGANMAISCIKNNDTSWSLSASTPLRPNTGCNGAVNTTLNASLTQSSNGTWRSSFNVTPLVETEQGTNVEATGLVEFFYAGSSTASKSFTASTKVSIPTTSADDVREIAQGLTVTKVRAGGEFTCAIANLTPYCWGIQNQLQTARSATATDQLTPLPSATGGLAGKRVYDLTLGHYNGCALADGRAYCWGPNNVGQLGTGGGSGVSQPAAVGGDLASRYVQKIGQGTSADQIQNTQFGCAISGNKTYCWGGNNYAQLGQVDYNCAPIIGCFMISTKPLFTTGFFNAGSNLPILVFGYSNRQFENQSQIYNQNPTNLETGSYGVCTTVNGRGFCWGNRFVVLPGNDAGGTNDASGWKNASLSGKFATDQATGESTACMIADGDAHCWGAFPGNGTNPLLPDGSSSQVPNGVGSALYGVKLTKMNATDDNGPICMAGNGDAYCWGIQSSNVLSPTAYNMGNEAVLDVAAGQNFACFVANGSNYCYGANGRGAHGTGDRVAHPVPAKSSTIGLTSGEAATQISTGDTHSCAVVNGYIYCWGRNDQGQIGTSDRINRLQPYGVNGINNPKGATDVTTGASHSCGIVNGRTFCWGDDNYGQLGDGGANLDRLSAVEIGGQLAGKNTTSIDASTTHTCAVANGQAYCWGDNTYGQLGNNSTTASGVPVAVQGLSGLAVTKITVGERFSCAIANTQVYCWGNNQYGVLGTGSASTGNFTTAQLVPSFGGNVWTTIDAGAYFACGVVDGVTRCWGRNDQGQIGNNVTIGSTYNTPQVVQSSVGANSVGAKNTVELSAGTNHACSISNGLAYCWGNNTAGKLGDGTAALRNGSTPVVATTGSLGDNYPYKIAAGGTSTCAIGNGKITCWGAGSQGQLGVAGDISNKSTPSTWTSNYIRQLRVLDTTRMVAY